MYKHKCASSNAIGIPQEVTAVVYCGRDFEVQSSSCIASPYATRKVAEVNQTLHNARGRGLGLSIVFMHACVYFCVVSASTTADDVAPVLLNFGF